MPRASYKICKGCSRHASVVGELSHERLCVTCWEQRKQDALDQLMAHQGPVFDHWRKRLIKRLGAVPREELQGRT